MTEIIISVVIGGVILAALGGNKDAQQFTAFVIGAGLCLGAIAVVVGGVALLVMAGQ